MALLCLFTAFYFVEKLINKNSGEKMFLRHLRRNKKEKQLSEKMVKSDYWSEKSDENLEIVGYFFFLLGVSFVFLDFDLKFSSLLILLAIVLTEWEFFDLKKNLTKGKKIKSLKSLKKTRIGKVKKPKIKPKNDSFLKLPTWQK